MRLLPPGSEHHGWVIRIAAAVFLIFYVLDGRRTDPAPVFGPVQHTSAPASGGTPAEAGVDHFFTSALKKAEQFIKENAPSETPAEEPEQEDAEKPAMNAPGWLEEKAQAYLKTEQGTVVQALLTAGAARQETGGDGMALLAAQKRPDRPYKMDLKAGDGPQALCGAHVALHWKLYDTHKILLDSTHDGGDEPVSLTLGDRSLPPGLERAIPGMNQGGTRRIVAPGPLAYDGVRYTAALVRPGQPVIFSVELVETETPPPEPLKVDNVRDPDDEFTGDLCGRKVTLNITDERGETVTASSIPGKDAAMPRALAAVIGARAKGSEFRLKAPRGDETERYVTDLFVRHAGSALPSASPEAPPAFPAADSPESEAPDHEQGFARYHIMVRDAE